LHHRWFKNMEAEELLNTSKTKPNKTVNSLAAINKMKEFVTQNKLKVAVLQYISTQFNMKDDEEDIRDLFKEFDTHNKGVINISDFTSILVKMFGEIDGKIDADLIFQNIDLDGSGEISYNEFITAVIDGKNLVTNDRLAKAFKMFDKDSSGAVSVEEIRNIFGGDEHKWKKIVQEVDLNGDGEIDFEEFKIMMKGFDEKEIII
jgi:calcium-dependent protein kinase